MFWTTVQTVFPQSSVWPWWGGCSGHLSEGNHSQRFLDQLSPRVKVLILQRVGQEVGILTEQPRVGWALFWHSRGNSRENSTLGPNWDTRAAFAVSTGPSPAWVRCGWKTLTPVVFPWLQTLQLSLVATRERCTLVPLQWPTGPRAALCCYFQAWFCSEEEMGFFYNHWFSDSIPSKVHVSKSTEFL